MLGVYVKIERKIYKQRAQERKKRLWPCWIRSHRRVVWSIKYAWRVEEERFSQFWREEERFSQFFSITLEEPKPDKLELSQLHRSSGDFCAPLLLSSSSLESRNVLNVCEIRFICRKEICLWFHDSQHSVRIWMLCKTKYRPFFFVF